MVGKKPTSRALALARAIERLSARDMMDLTLVLQPPETGGAERRQVLFQRILEYSKGTLVGETP